MRVTPIVDTAYMNMIQGFSHADPAGALMAAWSQIAPAQDTVGLMNVWRLDAQGHQQSLLELTIGAGWGAQEIAHAALPDGTLVTAQTIGDAQEIKPSVTTIGYHAANGDLLKQHQLVDKQPVGAMHLRISSRGQNVLTMQRTGGPDNPYQDALIVRKF